MEDTTDWKTLINFQFGINLESEAAARNAVHDKFLDILNTTVTYEELVDRLDDKYDGNQEWTSNYIGNVSSAVDADSMTVETLFAGQLNMIIDGKITPASVLIKHENLDNDYTTGDDYSVVNNQGQTVTYRGCEMTLYLTTDPLDTPNSWAPVYVTVFTCDRDSEGNLSDWYPIGDTYVGEANIVGYNGANGGTGSFVTDNWRSDAAGYTPVSNYSYNVGNDYSIKAIVQTVDPAAETAFQSLLDRSKKLIDDERFAGEGIEALEDAYEEAARYYTIDADGRAIANQGVTRVRLIPVMADLDHALNTAIDYIREKYPNEEID